MECVSNSDYHGVVGSMILYCSSHNWDLKSTWPFIDSHASYSMQVIKNRPIRFSVTARLIYCIDSFRVMMENVRQKAQKGVTGVTFMIKETKTKQSTETEVVWWHFPTNENCGCYHGVTQSDCLLLLLYVSTNGPWIVFISPQLSTTCIFDNALFSAEHNKEINTITVTYYCRTLEGYFKDPIAPQFWLSS